MKRTIFDQSRVVGCKFFGLVGDVTKFSQSEIKCVISFGLGQSRSVRVLSGEGAPCAVQSIIVNSSSSPLNNNNNFLFFLRSSVGGTIFYSFFSFGA